MLKARTHKAHIPTLLRPGIPASALSGRRRGAVALGAALCLGLASCSQAPEPPQAAPKKVVPAWEQIVEQPWQDAQRVLDEAVSDFEELYGIELSVYVRVIDGPYAGLTAAAGGDERQYSASTIKAPLVMTALNHFGDDLTQLVEVTGDDLVGGSVINYTGSFTVEQLLNYVMAYSDNAAANALMDALGGFDPVNETIKKAGVNPHDYHLGNRMNVPNPSGDRSWISPSQAALFMSRIQAVADGDTTYDFTDQETAQLALNYYTRGGAQKFAAAAGSAAQKTGEVDGGVNDHGIFYTAGGPVAFGVTTVFPPGSRSNESVDYLLSTVGVKIATLLPPYNAIDAQGRGPSAAEAGAWNSDKNEDGIPDLLVKYDSDGDGIVDYDETANPAWFNPFRSY